MSAKRLFVTLVVLTCVAVWAARSAVVAGRVGQAHGDGVAEGGHKTLVPSKPPGVPADSLADLCRERAERVTKQLDPPCAAIIRPPFVLAGDLSETELEGIFAEIIRPACDALVTGYFRKLPDRPVAILMFSTEAAYRRAAEQLFFDRRVSRFGYYKPGRRTVLVNLAVGDGGLLHELTHVLMDADFPDAPHWLQEGLAAVHEGCDLHTLAGHAAAQCRQGSGVVFGDRLSKMDCGFFENDSRPRPSQAVQLVPRHNWRWTVLRRAASENRLPRVKELVTESKFRGAGEAADYAYARYFCWFLHDRGTLQPLYVTLRGRSATDPAGAATLLELLAAPDWESVDRDFRAWLEAIAGRPS